ncbi:MAG: sensor histidine kinase [Candidatus Adiutrix sp.]
MTTSQFELSLAEVPERLAIASYHALRRLSLPFLLIDRGRRIFMVNDALAETFAYGDVRDAEDCLRHSSFFPAHFDDATIHQLYKILSDCGEVKGLLLRGRTIDDAEITLELSAKATLSSPSGPIDFMEAFFEQPGAQRDTDAFLETAKKEAALAAQAKNEFLSNISHELRTPLNVIMGMLSMAVEEDEVSDNLKESLVMAKEGADRLFTILNDLITLSSLEARRLTADFTPFSIALLLKTLQNQFANKFESKNVSLTLDLGQHEDDIIDGGYNLILMGLEKFICNALKFVDVGGQVTVKADLITEGTTLNLECLVSDNGPGFPLSILESQGLFRQGDGSINRKHGGLGLGLRLVTNIVSTLGGNLILRNLQGGAEAGFSIPVTCTSLND